MENFSAVWFLMGYAVGFHAIEQKGVAGEVVGAQHARHEVESELVGFVVQGMSCAKGLGIGVVGIEQVEQDTQHHEPLKQEQRRTAHTVKTSQVGRFDDLAGDITENAQGEGYQQEENGERHGLYGDAGERPVGGIGVNSQKEAGNLVAKEQTYGDA